MTIQPEEAQHVAGRGKHSQPVRHSLRGRYIHSAHDVDNLVVSQDYEAGSANAISPIPPLCVLVAGAPVQSPDSDHAEQYRQNGEYHRRAHTFCACDARLPRPVLATLTFHASLRLQCYRASFAWHSKPWTANGVGALENAEWVLLGGPEARLQDRHREMLRGILDQQPHGIGTCRTEHPRNARQARISLGCVSVEALATDTSLAAGGPHEQSHEALRASIASDVSTCCRKLSESAALAFFHARRRSRGAPRTRLARGPGQACLELAFGARFATVSALVRDEDRLATGATPLATIRVFALAHKRALLRQEALTLCAFCS
mmetsp:Transcript_42625/g.123254  ORF Transcript_42625/g.123254 Transcript_42625/m.123254 type:complete len:319 (-) Transcript_42625:1284-2240(-)